MIKKGNLGQTFVKIQTDVNNSGGNSKNSEQGNVIEMVCQLLRIQSAPEVDIEPFYGNALNYHNFMAIFKEVVENKINDPRGRLTRLIQYTAGEARDMIHHCIQQPSATAYKTAMMLLQKRYGDAKSFRSFHNFLMKCQSMAIGQKWNIFDTPETICMLISKLPAPLIDRWKRGRTNTSEFD